MTLHLPAETALALALALNDARFPLELKRSAAAATIEDLIAFLDDTDGDCDLEPDGTEQDCSASSSWAADSGHDENDEAILGWSGNGPNLGDWPGHPHSGLDRERDDSDDEPSLGSLGQLGPHSAAFAFMPWSPLHRQGWEHNEPGGQHNWAGGRGDDDEVTNEDGGDILDEAHDFDADDDEPGGDDEPLLRVGPGDCRAPEAVLFTAESN